jgi:hypothetical protein
MRRDLEDFPLWRYPGATYLLGVKKGGPLAKASGACDFCRSEIPLLDFQEGRASVVSSRVCCAVCLERGEWFGSAKRPRGMEPVCPVPTRFVPTASVDLSLRLPGWRGLLYGNLSRLWLDVSGEGLRAVVGRRCAVGDLLMARIFHRPTKQVHEIVSTVCHVQESRKFPGSIAAGFLFANPTSEFRNLIRDTYGSAGILAGRAQEPTKKAKKLG